MKSSVRLDLSVKYSEDKKQISTLRRKLSYWRSLKDLKRYVSLHDNMIMMDLGAGSGGFLNYVKQNLPDIKIEGVEYDPRLVEVANRNLGEELVKQGDVCTLDVADNSVDVIVSLQVIEHLYEPEIFIKEVYRVLKPGGVFMFTTPNLQGLGRRIMGSRWQGWRADHVSLRSRSVWDRTLILNDFQKLYSASTFFTGIPLFRRAPFSIINNILLLTFGSLRWNLGESYLGIHRKPTCN